MSLARLLTRTSRAEWSRIWSVRSSWILAAVMLGAVGFFATLIGLDANGNPAGSPPGTTAWQGGRIIAIFTLFGTVALAVVVGTADYGTGGIVPTLQWTPRRGVLLSARAAVVVGTLTALGVALVGAASVLVAILAPGLGLPADQGARVLGNVAFVCAGSGLLGFGLGLVTRSTAGALVSMIALMLILPIVLAQVPNDWAADLAGYLPGAGALRLLSGGGPVPDLSPAAARWALGSWAVLGLVAGGWRLVRTDANH